jgi:hypothetical protein
MLVWLSAVAFADPLVAVVVIDQAAREEGYALELEDLVVEDALPIDVAVGEHVRIVDPDGRRHELDVAPGEAWQISGPRGEAWMAKIGEEIRTDLLYVRGEPRAVKALARALHAEVREEDGRTLLLGADILFAAPWVSPEGLDRLDEVSLVEVSGRAARSDAPAPRRLSAPVVAPVGVAAPGRAAGRESPRVDAAAPHDTLPTAATPSDAVASLAVAPTRPALLDGRPYQGLRLCGDGTVLHLWPGGFTAAGVRGTWVVSAPGVVRLFVQGMPWGRAAFIGDTPYCQVVWRD